MKTLDRYILRQLIAVTFLGVLSLTLLMLLGQLFKELHSLLVESGAPPSIVVDFILQVIPFSLSFSVPWGFLTAVLLVYGRLAADNELTSMRMAGLSLWRLSMPAICLGVLLSGVCYYINIEIAPKGKQAMSELVVKAALDNPRNLLKASQNATKLDNIQIYIEGRTGDQLLGVHIYPLQKKTVLDPDNITGTRDTINNNKDAMGIGTSFESMHAQSADIGEFNPKTRLLYLTLHNAIIDQTDQRGGVNMPFIEEMPLCIHIPIDTKRKLKPNRFTNAEISGILAHKDSIRDLDIASMLRYGNASNKAGSQPYPCAGLLWAEALLDTIYYADELDKKNEQAFRTEGTQRASFACACIVFSLIGVPLAITARRRDTSTGFAIGILVAAVYFVALVFCELSRKVSGYTPYIVLWLPNVACAMFAIWQHQKAKYRG